tara:strand:+ start:148 stop:555 length:408 start_codon:yes stop_codon:yes gene_type:complete
MKKLTVALALLAASCTSVPAPRSEPVLFVGVSDDVGVGIYMLDGVVVDGFVAWDGHGIMGMTWPMTVLGTDANGVVNVLCPVGYPGKMLSVKWELHVTQTEDWCLDYRLAPINSTFAAPKGVAVSPARIRQRLSP